MSAVNLEVLSKKRIEFIDALKGFAIFAVLWGHSLQYLKNDYDFFHNPMFEFFYSFHMALFFLISGFFFRPSLNLNIKEYLVKKSLQLLLPCLVWAVIFFLMGYSVEIAKGNGDYFSDWLEILKKIFINAYGIWFLRELFISYFIVYFTLKVLKKEWLACVLSVSFVLISPFLCEIQRVFLPIFWVGFFLKNHYHLISKYAKEILIISATLFAICLFFWDGSYTMYVTKFPSLINFKALSFNFTNVEISIFRLFIGLCGSLFFFTLFEIMYSDNKFFGCLTKIGANTLAIYLLQRLILENLTNNIFDFPNMDIWIYNLLVTPLVSLVILIFCFIIIKSVRNIKYAELLLFGKT
jgi:fucose 4-O-acetylase-like acetyltransferase